MSILIPLLNDAHRVTRCARALARQIRVPKVDIVFLDAGSTDLTRPLLLDTIADDPRMRLLIGSQPPRGWCAYAHACEQLAIAARGKSFVFLDPGLALAPGAIAAAVEALRGNVPGIGRSSNGVSGSALSGGDSYDLLVAEARRRTRAVSAEAQNRTTAPAPGGHWGTRDISGAEAMTSARLLAVDAAAYWRVGGHSTAAHDPLGELGLVRALRRSGARVATADGRHAIEFLDATAWPRDRAGVTQPQTVTRHGMSDTENSILHSFTDTARRLLSALALLPPTTTPSHPPRALTPSRAAAARQDTVRPAAERPSAQRPSAPDPYATQQHDPFALDPRYVDAQS